MTARDALKNVHPLVAVQVILDTIRILPRILSVVMNPRNGHLYFLRLFNISRGTNSLMYPQHIQRAMEGESPKANNSIRPHIQIIKEKSPKEAASTVASPTSTPRGGRSPEKEFLLTQDRELAKDTVKKWMRDTYKQPPR